MQIVSIKSRRYRARASARRCVVCSPPGAHSGRNNIDAKLCVPHDEGRIRDVHRATRIENDAAMPVSEPARCACTLENTWPSLVWSSHQSRSRTRRMATDALHRSHFLKYRPCWRGSRTPATSRSRRRRVHFSHACVHGAFESFIPPSRRVTRRTAFVIRDWL